MAKTSDSSLADLVEQARGMMAVNPMLTPRVEQFWQAQDSLLQEAETFSEAWFQRRHEAAQSARDIAHKMNGDATDPSRVMDGIMEWQRHSFERMAEDMQQWVDFCARCAGHMTATELEAEKDGVEEAAKRTKSATKTNHSTPV
ncbi:MAG: hypothetical protein NXH74_11795 [Rhodobacteraceae bacterium]|jgi:hypothetical protein|nr:hypothetical protein [Paracoccaceae bacterium]